MAQRFNVRVYGLLVSNEAVLVSDEYIKGHAITKFPGGGLEFGEGTIECVIREFKEELGIDVEVLSHFYTTDFYVASSFNPSSQVISIYYLVKPAGEVNIAVEDTPHAYVKKEGAQRFRWLQIRELKDDDLTLIIDKKVAEMLKAATKGAM